MSEIVDYAIVGGGPAGLAVAIIGAMAGHSAVVIERRTGDVDKACGEGVMPPGVAWLRRMGVDLGPSSCRPFRGIRYVDGDAVAEAAFAEGPGLGIRRTALSSAMRARAAALGVEIRQGAEATIAGERADCVIVSAGGGEIRARWLVGADGLHGRTGAALGAVSRAVGGRRRFGVRRHFQVAPWTDLVEVHWASGVEAYVTPVSDDLVGVAFLWSAGDAETPGDHATFLKRFPRLLDCLGAAAHDPVTSARGGGPFDTRVAPIARGRMLLVGDAAGYVDAITGEGLSLAFASAAALVDATAADDPLLYSRAWRRIRRQHVALTRAVLWIADRPALRRRVVRALGRRPRAFRGFLGLNTGASGWVGALPAAIDLAGGVLADVVVPRAGDPPRKAGQLPTP